LKQNQKIKKEDGCNFIVNWITELVQRKYKIDP